jgi:hypothetical protein
MVSDQEGMEMTGLNQNWKTNKYQYCTSNSIIYI